MTYTVITGSSTKFIDSIEADRISINEKARIITFLKDEKYISGKVVAVYNLDYVVKVYTDEVEK